ncbi:MAG: Xylose operon regulatory protein [Verrucomicrobiota bacterium]|jgi:LacI family transcriptional regulator
MKGEATMAMISTTFRPGIVDGAAAYCLQHGLWLDPRYATGANVLRGPVQAHGCLVHIPDPQPLPPWLGTIAKPVIHLTPRCGFPSVSTDYHRCAAMAAAEFAALGITVVACPGTEPAGQSSCSDSFTAAAAELGLNIHTLPSPAAGSASTASAMAAALAALPHPCGFYQPCPMRAYAVAEALLSRGMRIPENVAIISTENEGDPICALAPCPITAIRTDDWTAGFEAARALHAQIDGQPPAASPLLIKPSGICRRASTARPEQTDPLISRALDLIHSPQGIRLRIAELAQCLAVARRTLEIRFRAATGRTLHYAITEQRIAAASSLLKDQALSLGSIAQRCGFSSAAYFITAFRRATGSTPTAWRRDSPAPLHRITPADPIR